MTTNDDTRCPVCPSCREPGLLTGFLAGGDLPALSRRLVDATEALLFDTEADEDRRRWLRTQAEQATWNVREHLNRRPT